MIHLKSMSRHQMKTKIKYRNNGDHVVREIVLDGGGGTPFIEFRIANPSAIIVGAETIADRIPTWNPLAENTRKINNKHLNQIRRALA